METIWKDIPNYIGYYQISNTGQIKSLERKVKSSKSRQGLRTVNERLIKTRIDKYGYETVILRKENIDKHFTIHRLVATCFIPNPENLPSINHKDENKLNNIVDNLQWCTVKYNNLYNNRQTKINNILKERIIGKAILQYDLEWNLLQRFKTLRGMHRETGFSREKIKRVCNGLQEQSYGYYWKFE